MAEFKVILGSKKRTIQPIAKKGEVKEPRTIDAYFIITTDAYNYILSQYEMTDESDDKSTLEIEGKHYKQLAGNQSYHSTVGNCVRHYVDTEVIKNPSKDILKLSDAIALYEEATLEFKSLLML